MSGMIAEEGAQKAQFYARLERIHAVPPEARQPEAGGGVKSKKRGRGKRDIDGQRKRLPIGGIIAFVIALAALIAANVIVFSYRGSSEHPGTFITAIGPFGVVGIMMAIVMIGFGLRDKPHVIGIALGLVAAYYGEPYLAASAPDLWADMYSADHLDLMLIQAGLRDPLGFPG